MLKFLGIAGSLRTGSFNLAALKAAAKLTPEDTSLEIFENLGAIPLFNQDLENNPPEAVVDLKKRIEAADAIVLATPEYNYSIPGVLKNAIDWASRPYGKNSWEGKPVAILSASNGMLGGARAQYQLRQVFIFLNMHPLNRPEVIIPEIAKKVNTKGEIMDAKTLEKISELMAALANWTEQLQTGERALEQEPEGQPYESAYGRMGGKT